MREPRRYLGLELAGAKNQKTALAALEFYPKEHKLFLLDIFEKVSGYSAETHAQSQTNDEALLELVRELNEDRDDVVMGVNVPLDLPPCVTCSRRTCPMPRRCTVPAVRWMREQARRHADGKSPDFTPYTQRPVELWLKHHVIARLPESHRFEVDETLGGNKAPLTVRMNFLKRHLPDMKLLEVSPKLSVASLGLSRRLVTSYRNLEAGAQAREEILEALAEKHGIFVYERDARKLSHNLASFDAFICAFTAVLADLNLCAKAPAGFPAGWTWTTYPSLEGGPASR